MQQEVYQFVKTFAITFGGMCSWRRVAVARVFALVVRCRVMMLFVYSRVGKNRDTTRGSPAGAGAGRTAGHLTFLFSQKVLAVRSANCIYRPVVHSYFFRSISENIDLPKFAISNPIKVIVISHG